MWSVMSEPVEAAKEQELLAQALRVLKDPEDAAADVLMLMRAALGHIEGITGTSLLERTCVATTTAWGDLARLPVAPVSEISSITVETSEGLITLDPTTYRLNQGDPLEPGVTVDDQSSPAGESSIKVTMTAGYKDAMPPEVWWSINLLIGQWWRTPMAATDKALQIVPNGVHDILVNHRRNLL